MELNYSRFSKTDNGEMIITLGDSKLNFVEKFKVSSTRNITLNITKNKDIYVNKIEYNVRMLAFEEKKILTFEGDNKNEVIELIDEMFKEHNIKSGKEILVNSFDSLITYLKNSEKF